jgi:PIN domain nuclease of toxin-antitoxin system
MRLLLDTHVLFWFLTAPERLRAGTYERINDPGIDVLYSALNLWELATKRAKGQLPFDEAVIQSGIDAQSFIELPITSRHGLAAGALPRLHGDPFDRMLIAQAMVEGLTLVTHDWLIHRYPAVALMEA